MAETQLNTPLKKGDSGTDVKIAQEWLTYHGFATAVDRSFGPATEEAVKHFQAFTGLEPTGIVDPRTFWLLVRPARDVQLLIPQQPLGRLFVAYAVQHLDKKPIEIGGENCGPWVRLYMSGNEGPQWPWCAGFATWVLRQACQRNGQPMPHPYAFGCDYLAGKAEAAGTLLRPKTPADFHSIKPGYLFLIPKTASSWQHIGIVESVGADTMGTIEGNTNDNGSSEGYEVCRRIRSLANKDFLIVPS